MPVTFTLATPTLSAPLLPVGAALGVNAASLPVAVQVVSTLGQVPVAIEVQLQETGEVFPLTAFTSATVDSVTARTFTGEIPLPGDPGPYTLQFTAWDDPITPTQVSPSLFLDLVVGSMTGLVVALPPAAIQIDQLYDAVQLQWANVTTPGFQGVRVKLSTDSSGVVVPYTQFGGLVPNNNTQSEQVTIAASTQVELSPDLTTRTTTLTETLAPEQYSSVTISAAQVATTPFYALLTTVVQDPVTFQLYESVAAGPFLCSYVNLAQVGPSDFPPTSTPEQIAMAIIGPIAQEYGSLDQSPRSETRDLQVDPYALEMSNATVRSWFTRCSASLSALCQIDDANGDGVSDPVATSPLKQMIAQAFRVTDTQVQTLIDNQFNVQAEGAGLTRQGATPAIVAVTFYVQQAPTAPLTLGLNTVCNAPAQGSNGSVAFTSLSSGVIDPAGLAAYWIPDLGGWGTTLNCICTQAGSIGNVGAGAISTVLSGASGPVLCKNLNTPVMPGQDTESNAKLATRVAAKRYTGIDSGTAGGYYTTAMACQGVIDAEVVCAGDLEMLRDWDPLRGRHTFNCVDIYARGASFSQVNQSVPYVYESNGTPGSLPTYVPLSFAGLNGSRIKFTVPSGLPYDVAAIYEVWLNRAGGVYLGVNLALWDPQSGGLYLNPTDLSYTYNSDGTKSYGSPNSAWLTGLTGVSVTGLLRFFSPLTIVPSQQPVSAVISIVGNGATGGLGSDLITLDQSASDPLIEGCSSRAADTVYAEETLVTVTESLQWVTGGPTTLDLGEGVYTSTITVNPSTGVPTPGNLLSVRSADASILYAFGGDYTLVVLGPYHHFGLQRTSGSTIPLDTAVSISFQRYQLTENLTLRTDTLTLSGSTAVTLSFPGLVANVQIPVSHGLTALAQDANLVAALVPYTRRYLKVFTTDPNTEAVTVYLPGVDYTFSVDPVLGPQLSKFVAGTTSPSRIPDGTVVTVAYYTAEVFAAAYTSPQFLIQLATNIEATRHGGGDILAKTMLPNRVDMNLTVTLANSPTSTPPLMDPAIRTAISLAVSLVQKGVLDQSDVVCLVRALPGVLGVSLPLDRFCKADGSYVLGEVIPSGTPWVSPTSLNLPSSLFPVKTTAWVTTEPVLKNSTIPGGGPTEAFVGMLYEGLEYRRCHSLVEFAAATDLAFYLVGSNDQLNASTPVASQHWGKVLVNTPGVTANPSLLAYRVTYQVFGEVSAQDIEVSSLEYLVPGQIAIAYLIQS